VEFVYAFDEQAPGGRELLGGKGIGLAEMTALGVPVPPASRSRRTPAGW
jgi:phosphoenolpyruvate synthase/pyruvate phosphate dikinase